MEVMPRMGRPRIPLAQRLAAGLVLTDPPATHDVLGRPLIGPCLIWTGKPRKGYGSVWDPDRNGRGGNKPTHRAMYELYVGPIAGQVDHLCRVPLCAAPAHLEDVTPEENRRRIRRGAPSVRRPAGRCRKGHPFDEANTKYEARPDTQRGYTRRCRKCAADRVREARHAATGKRAKVKAHCLRGHPFDEANTYWSPKREKFCRACTRIRTANHRARKAARAKG